MNEDNNLTSDLGDELEDVSVGDALWIAVCAVSFAFICVSIGYQLGVSA